MRMNQKVGGHLIWASIFHDHFRCAFAPSKHASESLTFGLFFWRHWLACRNVQDFSLAVQLFLKLLLCYWMLCMGSYLQALEHDFAKERLGLLSFFCCFCSKYCILLVGQGDDHPVSHKDTSCMMRRIVPHYYNMVGNRLKCPPGSARGVPFPLRSSLLSCRVLIGNAHHPKIRRHLI